MNINAKKKNENEQTRKTYSIYVCIYVCARVCVYVWLHTSCLQVCKLSSIRGNSSSKHANKQFTWIIHTYTLIQNGILYSFSSLNTHTRTLALKSTNGPLINAKFIVILSIKNLYIHSHCI